MTINDVAQKAGVAKSTVSKVLNDYEGVSKETRDKVLKVVNELGFVPNEIAANLSKKQVNKIAVILKTNYDEHEIDDVTLQYMYGVKNQASNENFELDFYFSRQFVNYTYEQLVAQLRSKFISAVIIFGLNKEETNLLKLFKSNEFKTVAVDVDYYDKDTTCIKIDNYQAQYDIAKKYILEYDKSKILYLMGKDNSYIAEKRTQAIRDLEQELGIDVVYVQANFEELEAYKQVAKNYLGRDMIIAASDSMIIGAKMFLLDNDLFMPLLGFDGVKLLRYVGEDIPTVKQDFYKMSTMAVEEAIRLINGEHGREQIIEHEITYIRNIEHQILEE